MTLADAAKILSVPPASAAATIAKLGHAGIISEVTGQNAIDDSSRARYWLLLTRDEGTSMSRAPDSRMRAGEESALVVALGSLYVDMDAAQT